MSRPRQSRPGRGAGPIGRVGALGWYCVGVACYQASRTHRRRPAIRRAIAALRRAVLANPSSADLWALLGRAHARNRDWNEARKAWLGAIDLDPHHRQAHAGLDRLIIADARRSLVKGDGFAALALLEGLGNEGVLDPEAVRLSVWGFALTGAPDEARALLAILAADGGDDADSYVRVGQAVRKDGRLAEAAELFRCALAKDPANRRARIFLARTIEKTEPEQAVALWQGLLADGLVGSEARQVLDRIAAARNKPPSADAGMQRPPIVPRFSKPGSAGRVRVWEESEDGADSPDSADDAPLPIPQTGDRDEEISARPANSPVPHPAFAGRRDDALAAELERAAALESRGAIVEAENAYIELWRGAGDAPHLLKAYGEFQLRRENFAAAYQLFQRLADDFTHGPFAYRQMAKIHLNGNRPDDAEGVYRDALIEFDDAGIVVDYACFLAGQGRIDDALDSLRRLDWDDRGAVPAYRLLARRLVEAGDPDSAIKALAIGIQRFPQASALFRDHAKLLNERGRFAEAVAALEQLVARKPGDATNWTPLIYIIARAERTEEARATLSRGRAALGSGVDALTALGRAAERALMNEEAEALFLEATKAFPRDPRPHAEFGAYFMRQGALRSAHAYLSNSARLDPTDDGVQEHLRYVADALDFVVSENGESGPPDDEVLLPEALFPIVRKWRARGVGPCDYRPGRVMIITSSLTAGGAERQAANTVAELVRGRPGVTSVVLGAASLSSRRRRNFYLARVRHLPIDIVSLEDMAIDDPFAHPELAPYARLLRFFTADIRLDIARWIIAIRAQRPEVVHTWQDYINIAAGVAAILVGVPRVVLGTRNTRPDNKYRRLKRYMRTAYRELTLLPSVVLLNNSIAGARDYEAWLERADGDCAVIWNGLNLAGLTEQAREQPDIRASLGIPPDAPVIGGVFRMSDEKRPLLWLDAAAIVARARPDAHFILCGDGVLYNDALAHAARLGLADRTHMPGMISNIGAWYAAMSIFLLASRKEGLPNVLIEAQAFGMPVVSANVGGAAEVMIRGRTGWAVDEADAKRLAERVLWCLARPKWLKTCKAAAPAFVNKTFSLDAMAAKTIAAYGFGDAAASPKPAMAELATRVG